jgi:hypothetical protein
MPVWERQDTNARKWPKGTGQSAVVERAWSIAASGRRQVAWKLYVEHKLKPPVQVLRDKATSEQGNRLEASSCNLSESGLAPECAVY